MKEQHWTSIRQYMCTASNNVVKQTSCEGFCANINAAGETVNCAFEERSCGYVGCSYALAIYVSGLNDLRVEYQTCKERLMDAQITQRVLESEIASLKRDSLKKASEVKSKVKK